MAIKYVEETGLMYEINEKGERVLVRSTDSTTRAYLRFTNKTSRTVDIWWRDFRGTKHHYVAIESRTYYDVNSYLTHPWEFSDHLTGERYVINNCEIYRAPANIGGMSYRTNWNITVSVRSLKYSAMLAISERIKKISSVEDLGMPKTLEDEVKKLVTILHVQPRQVDVVERERLE